MRLLKWTWERRDALALVLLVECLVIAGFMAGCGDQSNATPSSRTKITIYSGGKPTRTWYPDHYWYGSGSVHFRDDTGWLVTVSGSYVIEKE